jgi:hypothetical protein
MAANIGFHQTECWLFLSSRATFNACHLQLLRYRTISFVFPTIYVCSRHGREVSSHVMESCSIKGLQKPCSFLVHVLVGAGRPFWNLFHLQAMRDQNVSFILGHTTIWFIGLKMKFLIWWLRCYIQGVWCALHQYRHLNSNSAQSGFKHHLFMLITAVEVMPR